MMFSKIGVIKINMADNQDEVETCVSILPPLYKGDTFQLTVMKFDEDYQQACLHYTYEQMLELARQVNEAIKSYEGSKDNG